MTDRNSSKVESLNMENTDQEFNYPKESFEQSDHSFNFFSWETHKAFQKRVKTFSESGIFQGTVLIVIFVNSIFLMFEVNAFYPSLQPFYRMIDIICLVVYTLEFMVKVYAEPIAYWKSSSNRFDFFVLLVGFIQVFFDQLVGTDISSSSFANVLPVLRTVRAARALRAMRAVSFVRGLQVILIALVDTTKKSFINVMLILLFTMFLFAIFGHYMFGYQGGDEHNWRNLGTALLTLFSFVTVDGWFEIQLEMDERTTQASRIFTILFIIIGHFIIFNIFISVNIQNIQEANESFHEQVLAEKEAALARKKETIYLQQHEDIRKLEQRQKDAECANFYEMVEPFQSSLRSDDFTTLEDLITNVEWIELHLEALEHLDDNMYNIRHHHYEMAQIYTEAFGLQLSKRLGR